MCTENKQNVMHLSFNVITTILKQFDNSGNKLYKDKYDMIDMIELGYIKISFLP